MKHEGMPPRRREDKRVEKRVEEGEREGEKACTRERERALASLFIRFSPPGPVLCKLGQPGVLLVSPEVLIPVLGPSSVLFSPAFSFLVF